MLKRVSQSVFLLILCLLICSAFTPPGETAPLSPGEIQSTETRIENYLRALEGRNGLNASVLVARDGNIIYENGFGFADPEQKERNTVQTHFFVGSVTKQFAAAAVLTLVDQKRIELDAPIGQYLAYLKPPLSRVTVRQLLSHTSGIATAPYAEGSTQTLYGPASRETVLSTFIDEPLRFPVGTEFEYSNSGYFLLGVLVEQISGKSIGDFFRTELFEKAQMNSSTLVESGNMEQFRLQNPQLPMAVGQLATSETTFNEIEDQFDMNVLLGAGSMVSNVRDLLAWNEALHGNVLFSGSTLEEMLTEHLGQYCLGVYRLRLGSGAPAYAHNGGIFGFHAYLLYVPDAKVSVVMLSNVENQYWGRTGEDLAAIVDGVSVELPQIKTLSPVQQEQYTGTFTGRYMGNTIQYGVVVDDGVLAISSNGRKRPLEADAADAFYTPLSRATYVFERDDADGIVALRLDINGIPIFRLQKERVQP